MVTAGIRQSIKSKNEESSWLIATIFAGMGAGFIMFWVTLAFLSAVIICAMGVVAVWPLAKKVKGSSFAEKATIVYLIAVVIGCAVGFASSFGSGIPVTGLILPYHN